MVRLTDPPNAQTAIN